MKKQLWAWITWFLFLFVLDFTVPFFVLDDIPRLRGSFLFWIVWMIIAVISMFIMFMGWKNNSVRKGGAAS